jgi:outer membrane lipoprotein SlyB
MTKTTFGNSLLVGLSLVATVAVAQSSVSYGRITAVRAVTDTNARAQTGGALVGGTLGLISGSGQSGSNRALRAGGGALAGQQVARLASNQQAFEYTILIGGTNTITMTTTEAGMRVGDCVSVERGQFNNLRLVDDARCNRRPNAPATAAPPPPPPAAVKEADACVQAKNRLLEAETEEAFNVAERRMRLLCSD